MIIDIVGEEEMVVFKQFDHQQVHNLVDFGLIFAGNNERILILLVTSTSRDIKTNIPIDDGGFKSEF